MLNDLYQSLDPVAFSVGPFSIRWYGLAYIAGFIVAALVLFRVARRWKMNLTADELLFVVVGVAFGIIVGARLFYVLFYNFEFYLHNPLHILMFTEGGMSFHGGLVGALAGGFIVCRILKLSFVTMCDMAIIGAPWGLFFGRCANFVNGELWGKETDVPWAVMFETGGDVMRHPSQLYEAVLEGLVMFCVLYALSLQAPSAASGHVHRYFFAPVCRLSLLHRVRPCARCAARVSVRPYHDGAASKPAAFRCRHRRSLVGAQVQAPSKTSCLTRVCLLLDDRWCVSEFIANNVQDIAS